MYNKWPKNFHFLLLKKSAFLKATQRVTYTPRWQSFQKICQLQFNLGFNCWQNIKEKFLSIFIMNLLYGQKRLQIVMWILLYDIMENLNQRTSMLQFYGLDASTVVYTGTRHQCARIALLFPREARTRQRTLKDKLIESSYFITLLSDRKREREWKSGSFTC